MRHLCRASPRWWPWLPSRSGKPLVRPSASGQKAAPAAKSWTQPEDTLGRSGFAGNLDQRRLHRHSPEPARQSRRPALLYRAGTRSAREPTLERQLQNDLVETVAPDARVGTGPPGHWGERARRPCKQTSLVVDPPNGRTPDLLPEAKTRPVPEGAGNNNPKADSWEDFSYYIRCITPRRAGLHLPGHLRKRTTDRTRAPAS